MKINMLILLGTTALVTTHLHATIKLTVMTKNCYAFPPELTSRLKKITGTFGKEVNLVSGITKSIPQRIDEIALFVKRHNPDVIVFQELWKNDNKTQMSNDLKDQYPHIYWIPMTAAKQAKKYAQSVGSFAQNVVQSPSKLGKGETYAELNPFKLDSGLFIGSKFPFIHADYITYDEKAGDEVNADKGALVVHFNDRNGNPVVLATSHLQSWRDLEFVQIRHNQFRQLGRFLASKIKEWGLLNPTLIILGDFNDPITYHQEPRRLIYRTGHLTQALGKEGIKVSNSGIFAHLQKKYNIQEILNVNEPDKTATLITKSASGRVERIIDNPNDPLFKFTGRFYDLVGGVILYDYFEDATEPRGIQLLDQIFTDPQSKILDFRVFRKETLGDNGSAKPYNSEIAISDHAAVMATIGN